MRVIMRHSRCSRSGTKLGINSPATCRSSRRSNCTDRRPHRPPRPPASSCAHQLLQGCKAFSVAPMAWSGERAVPMLRTVSCSSRGEAHVWVQSAFRVRLRNGLDSSRAGTTLTTPRCCSSYCQAHPTRTRFHRFGWAVRPIVHSLAVASLMFCLGKSKASIRAVTARECTMGLAAHPNR